MVDPDDAAFFRLGYAHENLERLAGRLAEPERAYLRAFDYFTALLLASPGGRLDLWVLYDLAAALTVDELIRDL